jgi:hypothetical protein
MRKFRPARGWPEFIDEITIVVVGVILALSAQELLSQLHDRSAARTARTNVLAEVGGNITRYRERLRTQACIDRRLDLIARLLAGSAENRPVPHPLWLGRPQFWGSPTGRWQALLTERQNAFSSDELGRLSTLYATFDQVRDFQESEQISWAKMRVLEQGVIDPSVLSEARIAYQEARLSNYQIYVAMTQAVGEAVKLGATLTEKPRGSLSICLPANLPRQEALARIGRKENEEP